jgi:hypothetical protein
LVEVMKVAFMAASSSGSAACRLSGLLTFLMSSGVRLEAW